jgi:hypothetical protein
MAVGLFIENHRIPFEFNSLLLKCVAKKGVVYCTVHVVRKKWHAVSSNDKIVSFYEPRALFLSRQVEIEKSDSINFIQFLHDGQCVLNYPNVFFIVSLTPKYIITI